MVWLVPGARPGGAMMSRLPARVTEPPMVRVSPGRTSRRPVEVMERLPVVAAVSCGARVPVAAVMSLVSEPLRMSLPALMAVGPV